ncbi:MAG TPA: hypothetical protein VNZ52_14330 [Candidatus Thermoplasmatota archaeon]|nr:hypothetical protein [Candidatus Thermoplasmatota archaeon]
MASRGSILGPGRAAGFLLLYVAASSILGLGGILLVMNPVGAARTIAGVWAADVAADACFAFGSAAAGALAFALARQGRGGVSLAAAFLLNWGVYGLSYLLLLQGEFPWVAGGAWSPAREHSVEWGLFQFVLGWGSLGLAFATFGPWALALRLRAREAAAASPQAERAPPLKAG